MGVSLKKKPGIVEAEEAKVKRETKQFKGKPKPKPANSGQKSRTFHSSNKRVPMRDLESLEQKKKKEKKAKFLEDLKTKAKKAARTEEEHHKQYNKKIPMRGLET